MGPGRVVVCLVVCDVESPRQITDQFSSDDEVVVSDVLVGDFISIDEVAESRVPEIALHILLESLCSLCVIVGDRLLTSKSSNGGDSFGICDLVRVDAVNREKKGRRKKFVRRLDLVSKGKKPRHSSQAIDSSLTLV